MLEQFTAHLTPFGKDRVVRVWLPDEIETPGTGDPVMYMFDGHNLFRDEWATYGTCWGLADFLARWEKPMIVVAPECDREGNNRLIEYSPYDPMELPPYGTFHGRGAEYMDWLLGELKPWVDSHYPTIPFRETTGVGGSSMGGLMSLFAVLRYNRWFSKAACLSSSLRFCYPRLLQEAETAALDRDTRVYLSWGSAECQTKAALANATDLNLTMSRTLTRRGVNTYPYLHVGGAHCEADWAVEVPGFMDYLWRE